ncbi:MAG: MBL fold metallo-hydrolase [Bacillota bacterium]|nr:MBL fold metallo-hydrolase [Bacillota bacterium]MDW7730463.1 MBL fold metallo-hydrolase [Bacillota bacterium]
MRIKFLGAARTVTGSFYVIETEKATFAVECGMFQGSEALEDRNNAAYTIKPESIEFLILTHAHIDHSGLIPKLCKAGFKGEIYCSSATKDLCEVMLPDSGHIQEWEANRKNYQSEKSNQPSVEPIYTVQDAANALKQFRIAELDQITRPAAGVEFRFREAGHILGSCIAEIWVEEEKSKIKLVFSGDLGRPAQPFVKDPAFIEEADYLVIESTYGDRLHPEMPDRPEELKNIINETMKKGGNLIIPSFAVERTQDLLYDLSLLQSQGRLNPNIDIYIDSPLAIKATEIFKRHFDLYDRETNHMIKKGHHPLKMPNLKYSSTKAESMKLNERKSNTIIISASGMCDAGRIQYHLQHNLWRPESTILFVGYQAEGTLGRQIVSGEKLIELLGRQITVKARIEDNRAYSAHADQRDLLNWLHKIEHKPKTIFIVHGEEEVQKVLSEKIQEELKIATVIPDWLDEVELRPA